MAIAGGAPRPFYEPPAGLDGLVGRATRAFTDRFGAPPRWLAAAPGRVNLIGEHTDYNGGYVLPMAIDRYAVVAGAPAAPDLNRMLVHSETLDATGEIPLGAPLRAAGAPARTAWIDYVRGVVAGFAARGPALPALDMLIASDVPVGGGLSSSAALEVATATLLEAATGAPLDAREKARLCRQAEHDFAGVPCGLMDQLAATFGDAAGALLIDCTFDTVRRVPFDQTRVSVLVCNTNVRHALADGAYAQRRAQCIEAAACLGVGSLRDATAEMVAAAETAGRLDATLARRARHVVTENARTIAAAERLAAGDFAAVGTFMSASHRSLRDDYDVSCFELDALVDAAAEIGPGGGVLGARMTGGGFGGCAIVLVQTPRVEAVAAVLHTEYARRTGGRLDHFVARPARGAHLVTSAGAPRP